ncbi:hypothetical protein [Bacillus sp. 2205SS5-2]|uniref:hypothetical protein n=1 Tax=Bacillus sp. 2205SS5-2 TaxID=3109031 RepID=UPI003005B1AC
MKSEIEQALRIKSSALDVIEVLVKEDHPATQEQLKYALELMSRCLCDLVNVYTHVSEDHHAVLKGAITKSKICSNLINLNLKVTKKV